MMELKPCPFCGGKGELMVFKDPYIASYVNYNFCVSCYNCCGEGASSDVAQNSDCRGPINEAIEAWNTRVADNSSCEE